MCGVPQRFELVRNRRLRELVRCRVLLHAFSHVVDAIWCADRVVFLENWNLMTMDFQSAMETFAEAWVAANTKSTPLSDSATQVYK